MVTRTGVGWRSTMICAVGAPVINPARQSVSPSPLWTTKGRRPLQEGKGKGHVASVGEGQQLAAVVIAGDGVADCKAESGGSVDVRIFQQPTTTRGRRRKRWRRLPWRNEGEALVCTRGRCLSALKAWEMPSDEKRRASSAFGLRGHVLLEIPGKPFWIGVAGRIFESVRRRDDVLEDDDGGTRVRRQTVQQGRWYDDRGLAMADYSHRVASHLPSPIRSPFEVVAYRGGSPWAAVDRSLSAYGGWSAIPWPREEEEEEEKVKMETTTKKRRRDPLLLSGLIRRREGIGKLCGSGRHAYSSCGRLRKDPLRRKSEEDGDGDIRDDGQEEEEAVIERRSRISYHGEYQRSARVVRISESRSHLELRRLAMATGDSDPLAEECSPPDHGWVQSHLELRRLAMADYPHSGLPAFPVPSAGESARGSESPVGRRSSLRSRAAEKGGNQMTGEWKRTSKRAVSATAAAGDEPRSSSCAGIRRIGGEGESTAPAAAAAAAAARERRLGQGHGKPIGDDDGCMKLGDGRGKWKWDQGAVLTWQQAVCCVMAAASVTLCAGSVQLPALAEVSIASAAAAVCGAASTFAPHEASADGMIPTPCVINVHAGDLPGAQTVWLGSVVDEEPFMDPAFSSPSTPASSFASEVVSSHSLLSSSPASPPPPPPPPRSPSPSPSPSPAAAVLLATTPHSMPLAENLTAQQQQPYLRRLAPEVVGSVDEALTSEAWVPRVAAADNLSVGIPPERSTSLSLFPSSSSPPPPLSAAAMRRAPTAERFFVVSRQEPSQQLPSTSGMTRRSVTSLERILAEQLARRFREMSDEELVDVFEELIMRSQEMAPAPETKDSERIILPPSDSDSGAAGGGSVNGRRDDIGKMRENGVVGSLRPDRFGEKTRSSGQLHELDDTVLAQRNGTRGGDGVRRTRNGIEEALSQQKRKVSDKVGDLEDPRRSSDMAVRDGDMRERSSVGLEATRRDRQEDDDPIKTVEPVVGEEVDEAKPRKQQVEGSAADRATTGRAADRATTGRAAAEQLTDPQNEQEAKGQPQRKTQSQQADQSQEKDGLAAGVSTAREEGVEQSGAQLAKENGDGGGGIAGGTRMTERSSQSKEARDSLENATDGRGVVRRAMDEDGDGAARRDGPGAQTSGQLREMENESGGDEKSVLRRVLPSFGWVVASVASRIGWLGQGSSAGGIEEGDSSSGADITSWVPIALLGAAFVGLCFATVRVVLARMQTRKNPQRVQSRDVLTMENREDFAVEEEEGVELWNPLKRVSVVRGEGDNRAPGAGWNGPRREELSLPGSEDSEEDSAIGSFIREVASRISAIGGRRQEDEDVEGRVGVVQGEDGAQEEGEGRKALTSAINVRDGRAGLVGLSSASKGRRGKQGVGGGDQKVIWKRKESSSLREEGSEKRATASANSNVSQGEQWVGDDEDEDLLGAGWKDGLSTSGGSLPRQRERSERTWTREVSEGRQERSRSRQQRIAGTATSSTGDARDSVVSTAPPAQLGRRPDETIYYPEDTTSSNGSRGEVGDGQQRRKGSETPEFTGVNTGYAEVNADGFDKSYARDGPREGTQLRRRQGPRRSAKQSQPLGNPTGPAGQANYRTGDSGVSQAENLRGPLGQLQKDAGDPLKEFRDGSVVWRRDFDGVWNGVDSMEIGHEGRLRVSENHVDDAITATTETPAQRVAEGQASSHPGKATVKDKGRLGPLESQRQDTGMRGPSMGSKGNERGEGVGDSELSRPVHPAGAYRAQAGRYTDAGPGADVTMGLEKLSSREQNDHLIDNLLAGEVIDHEKWAQSAVESHDLGSKGLLDDDSDQDVSTVRQMLSENAVSNHISSTAMMSTRNNIHNHAAEEELPSDAGHITAGKPKAASEEWNSAHEEVSAMGGERKEQKGEPQVQPSQEQMAYQSALFGVLKTLLSPDTQS